MPAEAPFPRGAGAAASTKRTAADDSRSKKAGSKRAAPDDAADYLFGTRPAPKDKKARTTEGGVKGDMGIRAARAAAEVGAGMVLEQKGRPSKLELVSFKKLTKGTLLLGVVMRVGSDDLIVALPSSLTGIVRRADVSDQLHSITATDDAAPPNSRRTKRSHDDSTGLPPLTDYLQAGQVVRCAVKSLSSTGAAGGRRIELSLRASVINKGLTLDQLREGASAWGSISSVEDHGYVVGLGLDGVSAFLHKQDVHPAGAMLKVGQPIDCAVKACKSAARAVFLSNQPALVKAATAGGGGKRIHSHNLSAAASGLNLRGLKPGMLIEGLVEAQLLNGKYTMLSFRLGVM
jgi:rRNA biogenesis protein RRP5